MRGIRRSCYGASAGSGSGSSNSSSAGPGASGNSTSGRFSIHSFDATSSLRLFVFCFDFAVRDFDFADFFFAELFFRVLDSLVRFLERDERFASACATGASALKQTTAASGSANFAILST